MDCPRCGQADVSGATCPRCGVVFAKLRPARPAPSLARFSPRREARSMGVLTSAALIGLVAATGLWVLRRGGPEASPAARTPAAPSLAAARPALAPLPSLAPPVTTLATLVALEAKASLSEADHAAALGLVAKLNGHQPIAGSDVQLAEDLHSRYANEAPLRDLLEASLVTVAGQEQKARRYSESAQYLRRAATIHPDALAPRIALAHLLLDSGDWTGAEAAARDALSRSPRDPDALEGLAYALFRQDRNREAADAFRAVLEVRDSAEARALLARIEKNLTDERGMTEQRLSHFHVRYDGEEHADVGREILSALERHYATLVGAFDHTPSETIPVILFTTQGYYDASGAPAWSGGVFDHTDGRIRVPVMGLTSALSPEMDGTLIHELTHAFINDMTRGTAPREIHEGVAQYMEGHRIAAELNATQATALAQGRVAGVMGFYLDALAFAEYLIASRGQGGINELLRTMGETGDVNEAFRSVYGQDFAATRQAFHTRFRQQQGG